jgi:hypothetical protein
MSSLIFHTDETQAYVATDTLAVASHDKRPLNFTTKAHILPHLRMIIAGTGVGGFLDNWLVIINGGIVSTGIDNLSEHTPCHLAALWARYKEQIGNSEQTTTVYHFGFSENTGLMRAYAYRSANGFRAEQLPYSLAAKPDCTMPSVYSLPQDIKPMMDEQRTIQAGLPASIRIYIGGEIQVHHLTGDGFKVFTQAKFEDFESDQKVILSRF